MKLAVLEVTLRTAWVHSLKEKRMIVRSLMDKLRNQFNVSVAEIDSQDTHQLLTIGIVSIAHNTAQADSILDNILNYIEKNTDAELIEIHRETI